jgi:hypothetical protein
MNEPELPPTLTRPGMYKPLNQDVRLTERDILNDLMVVSFPQCEVRYGRFTEWESIQKRIAPSGSSDDFAFVLNGHTIRRKKKSTSNWHYAAWAAKLRHFPSDGGGKLTIDLKINPTRWAAMAAEKSGSIQDTTLNHAPSKEKAELIMARTLDGSTNFISPGMRRRTFQKHEELLRFAISDFRRTLLTNLARSGLRVYEVGWLESTPSTPPPSSGGHSILVNWLDWRVDRLEHYVELLCENSTQAVRIAYFDARARFRSISSTIYPPVDLASELDRSENGISFSTRRNASENLHLYAKAPKIVRVERRWIRGKGQPEIPFTAFKERGIAGLIEWDSRMNPGSLEFLQSTKDRLRELMLAEPDRSDMWARTCSVAAMNIRSLTGLREFIADVLEFGGLHYPSQDKFRKAALAQLLRVKLFERRNRRENVVPVPALQSFLLELRQAAENSEQEANPASRPEV